MLMQLVDDVRAALTTRFGTDVFVDEGIRARNTQDNFAKNTPNRVVFEPSEDMEVLEDVLRIGEGDADEDNDCKRQLLNVMFAFDVSIIGYDAIHPSRDLAHRRRCFDIWEVVAQEVQRDYGGVSKWISAKWNLNRKDGVYGAELIAGLVMNIPLFDIDWRVVVPAGVPGEPKPVE